MPDTGVKDLLAIKENSHGEPLRRVRSFKMTSKGIVNRGDTFRESNTSLASDGSFPEHAAHKDRHHPVVPSESGSVEGGGAEDDCATSTCIPNVYRVALCGSVGVGKTALVNQFKTSEYMGGFEISIGRFWFLFFLIQSFWTSFPLNVISSIAEIALQSIGRSQRKQLIASK